MQQKVNDIGRLMTSERGTVGSLLFSVWSEGDGDEDSMGETKSNNGGEVVKNEVDESNVEMNKGEWRVDEGDV